jgi:hypothetical protein
MLGLVFRIWAGNNCLLFVYMQLGRPEMDNVTTGGKSVVFRRCEFILLRCVAVIKCFQKGVLDLNLKKINSLTCGVPSSVSWELFNCQWSLYDWLALIV